jgi:predicted nucleic acid-binding protein
MILVDANVLIDIVVAKSEWTNWSQDQLTVSSNEGLAINFVIYSEIASCFASKDDLDLFLSDFSIRVFPVTDEAAYLAAMAHQTYRRLGGHRIATLPDFFIGAHASTASMKLLTRDTARFTTYFPKVKLISPKQR